MFLLYIEKEARRISYNGYLYFLCPINLQKNNKVTKASFSFSSPQNQLKTLKLKSGYKEEQLRLHGMILSLAAFASSRVSVSRGEQCGFFLDMRCMFFLKSLCLLVTLFHCILDFRKFRSKGPFINYVRAPTEGRGWKSLYILLLLGGR